MAGIDREELALRVAALAQGWVDAAPEGYYDEATLGAIGLVFEIKWPEGGSDIASSCSDGRRWVQAGLFRRAMLTCEEQFGPGADEPDRPDEREDFDPEKLPPDLRHLAPLMRRWAISDDVQRTAAIEAASTDELEELREAVQPVWEEMEEWAKANERLIGKGQDEALLLLTLAEATAEAIVEISTRPA